MKSQFVGTFAPLMVVLVALIGVVGWVMNIVTLCNANFEPFTGMLVARVVGIFVAPLGAVLGYI